MYKASYNKNSEKGMTQLLLDKRNKQFHALFVKAKDPITIIQFYTAIGKVCKQYFGDESKSADWVRVMLHLYDSLDPQIFRGDMNKLFGLTTSQTDGVLKSMGKRGLLVVHKYGTDKAYSLSADGFIFIRDFKKDCAAAMLSVIRNGRTGKKRARTAGVKFGPRTA